MSLPAPPAGKRQRDRAVAVLLAAVFVAVMYPALVLVPRTPLPGLDPAWRFLLTYDALHHVQWGRDVQFTFGPLGYLSNGALFPGAAGQRLLYALGAPALTLVLVLLIVRRVPGAITRVAAAIVLAVASGPLWQAFIAIAFMVWAAQRRAFLHPLVAAAMGAWAGYVALAKIDLTLETVPLYVCVLAFARADLRRTVTCLLVFAGTALTVFVAGFESDARVAALYVAGAAAAGAAVGYAYARTERLEGATARQSSIVPALAGFVVALTILAGTDTSARGYALFSYELARGYSSAMSAPGPGWLALVAVAVLAAFAVSLRSLDPTVRGLGIGLAIVLAFAFKHGFVRTHVEPSFFAIAAVAAMAVLILSQPGRGRIVAATVVAVSFVMFEVSARAAGAPSELAVFVPGARVAAKVEGLKTAFRVTDANAYDQLASLRLPAALRAQLVPGALASLPFELAVPVVSNVPAAVPPVPQLFTAYTPRLDFADRDWVSSPHAPPNVLLGPIAIDGRYLLGEAPATSVAMWCRYTYAASGTVGAVTAALLHRTANRCGAPQPLARGPAGWDRAIVLPAVKRGEALVVHVDIRRSILGSVTETLFRLDAVTLRAFDELGGFREYRILPRDAADGIILQPLVTGPDEIRHLFAGDAESPPARVAFHTDQPVMYAPSIGISIERLRRAEGAR